MNASERRDLPRGAVAFDVDGVLLQGLFLYRAAWRKGAMVWVRSLGLGILHKLGLLSVKDVVERAYALQPRLEDERRARGGRVGPPRPGGARGLRGAQGGRLHRRLRERGGAAGRRRTPGLPSGRGRGAGVLLEVEDGILTGRVVGGRHTETGKRESLERMLGQAGFGWTETTVVVDDRSNSELVRAAWRSIGVNPELPILRDASFVLHTQDLREILQFFPEGYEVGVTPQRLAVRHEAVGRRFTRARPSCPLWRSGRRPSPWGSWEA